MKNIAGSAVNVGNIDVEGGEKTRIHEAAYGVLMDMLSGVYGNAAAAVLREYSVNGWDEHRKHGVTRPVEVTLPDANLQNILVIRDYGAGIPLDGTYVINESGERVCTQMGAMEVFGEYGNSSKRDTDVEVGGFGIGSKAAFALGQQFIVKGFKDGVTFTVLFTLNNDGTGTKTVMHEGPTTEPNGVEISLGVEDVEDMRASARRFFSFWERGDVLVDYGTGFEEPTPIFENLEQINDEIYIDSDGRGEAFAVMGPVAYPISRDILRKVGAYLTKQNLDEVADLPVRLVDSSTDIYLRVPIGGVRPAPSREALRDKDITIRTIGSVFLGLHQDSAVKIQQAVDSAPSLYAAARVFEDGNESLGVFKVSRKAVSWQGQKIRKTAAVDLGNFRLVQKSWRSSVQIVGTEPHATLTVAEARKSLVVTGISDEQVGSVRRFAKRYLEENEDGIERVFVTPADAVSFGWFQVGVPGGVRSMTLEEWRLALRKMRKSSPRTVNEPSYTTGFVKASRDLEDRDLFSEIVAEGLDVVIFHDSAARLSKYERAVLEGYTVVVLLGTQSEDALRDRIAKDGSISVVEWSTLRPLAEAAAQAVVDSFSAEEREALGARAWVSSNTRYHNNVAATIEALSLVGEVTNQRLLDVPDLFAMAEEFAAPLTEARLKEIRVARSALGTYTSHGLEDMADEFECSLPKHHLPLLDHGRVQVAARNIRKQVAVQEDGTVTYHPDHWSTYEEADHKRDLRILEHSLAYVNSH